MAWESLISAVEAVITANGNNEITGTVLKDLIANNLIPQLGTNLYKGIALTNTNPGMPEKEEYYFALKKGVYSNFSALEVFSDGLYVFKYDGTNWVKDDVINFFKANQITFDYSLDTPPTDALVHLSLFGNVENLNNKSLYVRHFGINHSTFDYLTISYDGLVSAGDGTEAGICRLKRTSINPTGKEIVYLEEQNNSGISGIATIDWDLLFSNQMFQDVAATPIDIIPNQKRSLGGIEARLLSIETALGAVEAENLTPENSRFDANTVLIDTTHFGVFTFTLGSATMTLEDGGVRVAATSTGGSVNFNNNTILTPIPVGNGVKVSFSIKRISGSNPIYIGVTTSTAGAYSLNPTTEWQDIAFVLPKGTQYPNRIAFFWANLNGTEDVIIKDLDIKDADTVFADIVSLDQRVTSLEGGQSTLQGKKISIIGDSISTASDNNASELTVLASDVGGQISAYVNKQDFDAGLTIGGYTVTESDIGVLRIFNPTAADVGKIIGKARNYNSLNQSQVWWGILAEHYGMEVLKNVSYSSSSMSSHNVGSNLIYDTAHAWHPATVKKCALRTAEGVYTEPEIICIYRGINDFSKTPYSLITDFGSGSTSIPDDDLVTGGFGFKEAYALTIKKLREAYPKAFIVCCTLNFFKRVTYNEYPVRNGVNTLPEYNDAIREVANQMGCGLIEFDKSGITFENAYPEFISDSATTPTHPNAAGHAKMASRAITDLKKAFN